MIISVCIPVFNTEKYLAQCLESLFNQTISNKCEFIIVNDCSPDNSAVIIDKLVKKYSTLSIKTITHNENKGLAVTRNTALFNASGEYIINIDSDDWCEPDYLEKMLEIAKRDDADIVISQCKNISENEDLVKLTLEHKIPFTVWTKLIRRDLFTKNNLKWIDGINVGEDVIISSKLLFYAKKISFTEKVFYHYRQSIGFVTKLKKINFLEQKKKEFDELERFFREQKTYDRYKDIIELRKAEVKYEYIKISSILSISKYKKYYPDTKLKNLFTRPDFNSKFTKLFIKTIDNRLYIMSNFFFTNV